VAAVLVLTSVSFAQVQPGDILIYDRGNLRAVSQNGTPVPGFEVSIPNQMEGLATGAGSAIYFTGAGSGSPGSQSGVYRVNPQTGVITTIATATSPLADYFRGIAVEPGGSLVVSTLDNDLLRINPTTGARTTIVPSGGFLTYAPFLQVGPDGTIYASRQNTQGYYNARVNPVTGAQTIVTSDQNFAALKGFAVAADNTIYAANISHALPAPGEEMGQILRIDPAGGQQSVLYTSNTNPTDIFNPYGIALDPGGNVLVADQ
jgi:sugar lactone lactonase YvrE